jgi:ankyrin repeat protein
MLSIRGVTNAKVWAHRRVVRQRERRHLWKEAFDKLSQENSSDAVELLKEASEEYSKPDVILCTVRERIIEADEKSWKYTRPNGDVIVLRAVLERTLRSVEKFQALVDVAVSCDVSGHAAAPWAILKFLLNSGLNSVKTRGDVVEAVEYISRIVALYAEVEIQSLRGESRLRTQLTNRLVDLYASILTLSGKARNYFATRTSKRFVKGLVQSSDMVIGIWVEDVKTIEDDVLKIKQMVDAETQYNLLVGCNRALNVQLADNTTTSASSDFMKRTELKQWLNVVQTDDIFSSASTARSTDTCNWMLERETFKRWIKTPGSSEKKTKLLWIHAGPGFGKTVLCARLIQRLQETKSVPVAYFFVISDDKSRRDPAAILRSWIFQIATSSETALQKIDTCCKTKTKSNPLVQEIWELFRDMIKQKRYCFVVDGYDECTTVDNETKYQTHNVRSQFLRKLISQCSDTQSLFLIVSRDQDDIRSALDSATGHPGIEYTDYKISTTDTRADVMSFSRAMTGEILAKKAGTLQEEIAAEAAKRADGLFLWINLLRKRLDEERGQNAKRLVAAVRQMPDGLENAYKQEFSRLLGLKGDQKERAMAILRWVLFASRPMKVRELAEALLLNSEDALNQYPHDELPDAWETGQIDEDYISSNIRLTCGSLVELRSSRPGTPLAEHTVHFVHFSVKEFLLRPVDGQDSQKRIDAVCFPDASTEHDRLARLCLQYLCYDEFGSKAPHVTAMNKRLHLYPFLGYAAKFWYTHAIKDRDMSPDVRRTAVRLFDPHTGNWRIWSEIFEETARPELDNVDDESSSTWDSDERNEHSNLLETPDDSHNDSDIGYDTGFELSQPAYSVNQDSNWDNLTVDEERQNDVLTDPCFEKGSPEEQAHIANPIYYAAWLGLTDIVRTLQAGELSCDSLGGTYGTPLQAAAANSQDGTVEYLISQGVDVARQGGRWGSAVCAATAAGSVTSMRLLVNSGADLRHCGPEKRNPMHLASFRGDASMVEALLEFDSSPELLGQMSCFGQLPLHEAIESGSLEVVKLLLQHKHDINAADHFSGSPIESALEAGREDIVQELVRAKADLAFRTKDGLSALHLAACQGMYKFIVHLVDHGVDVSVQTNRGWTALHYATFAPRSGVEIVRLLLRNGARINHIAEDGSTPLHVSAWNGLEDMAVFLLENGADINAQNARSQTPLFLAAMNRHDIVVQRLLDYHADPSPIDIYGNTPLDVALEYGGPDTTHLAETLLAGGALVDDTDSASHERLSDAVESLQISLSRDEQSNVLAVLDSNHSFDKRELNSILLAAAYFGAQKIALQLLADKANIHAVNKARRSTMHVAAYRGHGTLVQMLLQRESALIDRQGVLGSRPLDLAVRRGMSNIDVVETLLQWGAIDRQLVQEHQGDAASSGQRSMKEGNQTEREEKLLAGFWKGHYTYSSWNKGQQDRFSIEFVLEKERRRSLVIFRSEGADEGGGAFFVRGSFSSGGAIMWAKMYDDHGWVYSGRIDDTGRKITGTWGSSLECTHGSFILMNDRI